MKLIMENWKKFMKEEEATPDPEYLAFKAEAIFDDYVGRGLDSLRNDLPDLAADDATKDLIATAIEDFGGNGPGTQIVKANQKILGGYSLGPEEEDKALSAIQSAEAEGALKVLPWYWKYAPASIVFRPQEEEPPGLDFYDVDKE